MSKPPPNTRPYPGPAPADEVADESRSHRSVRRIRLLIVEDRPLCCEALAMLFQARADVDVVGAVHRVTPAIRLARESPPDVVLMDAMLPNRRAFRAARVILTQCPPTRLILLDEELCDAHVFEAIRVGAMGYWTKNASSREIAEAVHCVAGGQYAFCPAVRPLLTFTRGGPHFRPGSRSKVLGKLSQREAEVLAQLAEGLTVKQCAQRMGLAFSTVDNHKARLMKKLGVHRSVELVRLAVREGVARI